MTSAPPGLAQRPLAVWVTRAEPGASRTAARLSALGHVPLVAPLLTLTALPVTGEDVRLDDVAALAFTSTEGVDRFSALVTERSLRVYAVGDATAEAARAAGWREVRSADADGEALAALIAADLPLGTVLAPGAHRRAFDLQAALTSHGVAVRRLDLYAATAAATLPAAVQAALARGGLDALLIHSAAAARVLAAVASDAPGLDALVVLALSPACAAALGGGVGGPRRIAAAPRERDLLALLA